MLLCCPEGLTLYHQVMSTSLPFGNRRAPVYARDGNIHVNIMVENPDDPATGAHMKQALDPHDLLNPGKFL